MRNKLLVSVLFMLMGLVTHGINVKIEDARIVIDAKNNQGDNVIATHCKLNVSGIKGQKFDLVAIVEDDNGDWHKNATTGNPVKRHYTCTATYENTEWSDIQVYLYHKDLAPKPGKHDYKVYLYVYYGGEWYGRTYAGTYSHEGPRATSSSNGSRSSSSSSSSSSRSNSSTSSSQASSTTVTCNVCSGTGITTCLLCSGVGGFNQYRCLTYPPYTSYYEWCPCMACGGAGKVMCTWCSGTGKITIHHNNTNTGGGNYGGGYNSYGGGYNYNNSSSSSSSSSVYTTCRICGGSGVCTSCNGRGGEWRDTGYYTGSNSQSWINCPSCHGNKKCFNCYGTGRQ